MLAHDYAHPPIVSPTMSANIEAERRRAALRRFMQRRQLKNKPWADAAGVSEGAIRNFLNGLSDSLSTRVLERLARQQGVSVAALLGEESAFGVVKVKFYVGAGEEVFALDDADGIDEAEGPVGTEAAIIRGQSMYPVYKDRDIIFFDEVPVQDLNELLGEDCIVELNDGRRFLKQVRRGTRPGLFSLASYNAPEIEDVIIRNGAIVRWVYKPRRR